MLSQKVELSSPVIGSDVIELLRINRAERHGPGLHLSFDLDGEHYKHGLRGLVQQFFPNGILSVYDHTVDELTTSDVFEIWEAGFTHIDYQPLITRADSHRKFKVLLSKLDDTLYLAIGLLPRASRRREETLYYPMQMEYGEFIRLIASNAHPAPVEHLPLTFLKLGLALSYVPDFKPLTLVQALTWMNWPQPEPA